MLTDLDPPTLQFTLGIFLAVCVFAYVLFWKHFDATKADNE